MDPVRRLADLTARYLKLRSLLVDEDTGLSSVHVHLDEVRKLFDRGPSVGVVHLTIPNFDAIEKAHGWQVSDEVLRRVARELESAVRERVSGPRILASADTFREEFVLFLPGNGEEGSGRLDTLETLAHDLEREVGRRLRNAGEGKLPLDQVQLCAGYSSLRESSLIRFERMVFRGIEEARAVSGHGGRREKLRRKLLLDEILQQQALTILFQPILRLADRSLYGYEALARGPKGSPFEAAESLFTGSEDAHLSLEVDELCRRRVLVEAAALPEGKRLFLNVHPASVMDPARNEGLVHMVREVSLPAETLVLEIGERSFIGDLRAFRLSLDPIRKAGIRIALDDIGAGYSSLHALSEISPDYLKIDMSLTRDVDRSLIKQELIETLAGLAKRMEAEVVAEGVEREEELAALRERGVQLGQGFHLGQPLPLPSSEDVPGLRGACRPASDPQAG